MSRTVLTHTLDQRGDPSGDRQRPIFPRFSGSGLVGGGEIISLPLEKSHVTFAVQTLQFWTLKGSVGYANADLDVELCYLKSF